MVWSHVCNRKGGHCTGTGLSLKISRKGLLERGMGVCPPPGCPYTLSPSVLELGFAEAPGRIMDLGLVAIVSRKYIC